MTDLARTASKRLFDIVDAADFAARLPSVHRALYLLFNEGYHGASPESSVRAELCQDTNWGQIVSLYDRLTTIRPSPVVALNRAIAVAQLEGAERGLEEIHAIADRDRLSHYPFYSAALGELELRRGRREIARKHFQAAVALARNPLEQRLLEQRVAASESGTASSSV